MRRSVLALFATILLASCNATTSTTPTVEERSIPLASPDQLRDLTPAEKIILTKGFAAGLKDPDSAKFEWAKIQKSLPMDGPLDYCAVVNAKNSYGGYTGAKPFIGVIQITKGKITGAALGAVGDSDPRYQEILPKMCRDKGLSPYA